MNKRYLFVIVEILNSFRGVWFCKIVMRVWIRIFSLVFLVGLNKVYIKCLFIFGFVFNMVDMCRVCKEIWKMKLLEYSVFVIYI